MRRRALITCSVATVAATVLASSPTALAGTIPTSTSQNQSCTPLPLVGSSYVAADGSDLGPSATDAERGVAAHKKEYLLPDGRIMSTTIPPAGFDPQKASPAAAKAFGFTERERDGSYRKTIESVPCASHVVHSVPHGLAAQGTDGAGHTIYDSTN